MTMIDNTPEIKDTYICQKHSGVGSKRRIVMPQTRQSSSKSNGDLNR